MTKQKQKQRKTLANTRRERASNALLIELNVSTTIMQNNMAAPKKLK